MKEHDDSSDSSDSEDDFNINKNIDNISKEKEDPLKPQIKEEKKPIEILNKQIEPVPIENKEKEKLPIEKENKDINPIEIENKEIKPKEIEKKEKEIVEEIEIEIEKDEEEDLKDINLEEIKMGKEIICPEDNCFSNTIIYLNPITFEIKSDCGKHKKKMKIIEFVEKSGKKEEKDFCSICGGTYKEIIDNNKKLYKCYCGGNFCENCKENHLKEKDLESHNIVDFKDKDYTCCCNDACKKYISFCLDCKKNLCIFCQNVHEKHKINNFSKMFKLGKEEKIELKNKLKEQNEKIEKFKNIIDNWLKRIAKIIDIYKKKLELYLEINNIIINKYNVKKNYYEEIKNIENLRNDFDNHFMDLLKYEKDFKKQNEIILKLLNENYIKINKGKKGKEIFKLEKIFENEFNGEVKNICELKKENLLIVNSIKQDNEIEELNIYKISENNLYTKIQFNNYLNVEKIKNLSELRNGDLLITQKNNFKIVRFIKESEFKFEFNIIQNQKLEGEEIIQIIELINGNLVCISKILNGGGNNIIFWEKNLITDIYEKVEQKNLTKIPFSIIELNKYSFLVIFKEGIISIFSSKTNKELIKFTKINNYNPEQEIEKMIKYNEKNILFFFQKGLFIYNILLNEISNIFAFGFNIIDLSIIPNYNRIFLIYQSEKNDNTGIIPLYLNPMTRQFDYEEIIEKIHNNKITCIKILNNGDLVTGSLDKYMKIWKIKKNNKNIN